MTSPDPIMVQQQLLAELQDGMGRRLVQLQSVKAAAGQAALAQILLGIQILYDAQTFLNGFADRAAALAAQGFPALTQSLDAATQDVAGAQLLYLNNYQDTERSLASQGQIVADANRYAVGQILAGTYHQQAVFDHSMRAIRAVNNRTCVACGFYFGDTYPYWYRCPKCKTRL